MDVFRYRAGRVPLLVSMPHVGTLVPDDIAARMTEPARALPDTDWHVDQLYEFLDDLGAASLGATHSRYVVDLNRPPGGENLYPGRDTPGLVPTDTFASEPIYRDGEAPDAAEITARVARYWQPYHDRLRTALEEMRDQHGVALLWEAHSIRSHVPRLFEGQLPDLNLGTGGGTTCPATTAAELLDIAQRTGGYSAVLDARFLGGYTTRHYGDPSAGVHAVQLELSQLTYMDEDSTNRFREDLAARLRPVLRQLLDAFLASAGSR